MKFVFSIAVIAVALFSFGVMAKDETKNAKQGAAGSCQKCPSSDVALIAEGGCCQKCPGAELASVSVSVSTDEKCAGGCQTQCASCVVSAAMNKLPKMTFLVGTESTCCSEAAAELAKKASAPIQYVVAEKTFATEAEAYTALVVSTEEMVNAFVTPAKCETSGATTVAGKSCGCCVEAGKRTELVTAAIKDIKVSFKVGDKEACCPTEAAAIAKETGAATHYVVNGEETPCELTARLKVATAKYAAAMNAIAVADQAAAIPATPATVPATESTTEKSGT